VIDVDTVQDLTAANYWLAIALWGLFVGQVPALAVLLSRLLQGPGRQQPLPPRSADLSQYGAVSVVVPTLNEAERIGPCLEGLSRQSYSVREITIVDSRSQDDTVGRVKAMQTADPRFRVIYDDPLPAGWVGRPWALHTGFLHSSPESTWFLGIDADTQPQPGLVASLVAAAEQGGYDLVSLSPQFILKQPGEFWLQPALLMTLIYRFGPSGSDIAGSDRGAERVMANGQCFLCRRSLLQQIDGYTSARNSFCDDVTLARYAAAQGAKVGFLDGANLLKVRMYEGMAETWREWGRSLDLKDAATPAQTWSDVLFLTLVQGLPIVLLPFFLGVLAMGYVSPVLWGCVVVNGLLVAMRLGLLWAIASSYDSSQGRGAWAFWLSPLADPLAVVRIALSASRQPKQWRGRQYDGV
jgi:dolichol-phosphate mannosyltransferase